MKNSLFYNHVKDNDLNKNLVKLIEDFSNNNPDQQIYLISSPLGEKYKYTHEENSLVILSPKHKLIFINLTDDEKWFNEYFDDFIEDLSSISDKYEYKNHIGRPREWKEENTAKYNHKNIENVHVLFEENLLSKKKQRISELLISLLIGSINDINKIGAEIPETLLDKVKKNIILFDGDQTRFIYKDFTAKTIYIQGLSGTGKTELLLHKLKDIYLNEEKSKIFFTCHNIALSNTLRERIPAFFNFMKVEKQIEWNSRLWVNRAWGSGSNKDSGLYSYLCHFYNIPFLRFNSFTDYNRIYKQVLDHLNSLENEDFNYAFDYLLVDERQDFPDVFFTVCEKITKNKVYVAGDIFQDIFDNVQNTNDYNVDVVLNRCYRTDPRTLMFAHAIGMGLFEDKKLNWFDDKGWEIIGYKPQRTNKNEIQLSREPIRRFENLEIDEIASVKIKESTDIKEVIEIIKKIKDDNQNVKPEDIAIIILDENKEIYTYIDNLCSHISKEINWDTNRAYENKYIINDSVYITNPNNVKGLEFPFVICITGSIRNTYKYRNILYTMLTRSFIQSYLLVTDLKYKKNYIEGLEIINNNRYIKTCEPTTSEKEEIRNTLINFKKDNSLSYDDFISTIFAEQGIIDAEKKETILETLLKSNVPKFDREQTIQFINEFKKYLN